MNRMDYWMFLEDLEVIRDAELLRPSQFVKAQRILARGIAASHQ